MLNRNRGNPFEIAFGEGIFALLNHVLTVCAAYAQTWAELFYGRRQNAGAGGCAGSVLMQDEKQV